MIDGALAVERRPLSEQVADILIEAVKTGKLKPGDKVPSELELGKDLNVSRSTVREAVKQLVSSNIFEIHRGEGTFVCHNVGIGKDPLGFQFFSDQRQLALDLCEIRAVMEPWIVRKAAVNATDDDIKKMEMLCREVEDLIWSGSNHAAPDMELHKLWAECTGNSVAPNLIPILMQAIPLFIDVTGRSLVEPTIRTHRAIVDAIRRHDPEAAEKAMKEHIAFNRETMEKDLRDNS